MSNTQYAFIDKARVPDRAALQSSIDALGFDLKLHPDFTPFSDAGSSPFVLVSYEGDDPEPLDDMLECTREIIRDAGDEG